ncbi:MAG: hypothetical protein ACFFD7_03420, partial [Candidatus Thorarchaeota archaeon]
MSVIPKLYEKAKINNVFAGIIIGVLITLISYLLFPSGLVFFGDFQILIGQIIGVYFSLSNLKETQSEIKLGLTVSM